MEQQTTLFYSHHAEELVGSTDDKIRAILAQDAIEYVAKKGTRGTPDYEPGYFLVHPLKVWDKHGNPKIFPIGTFNTKPDGAGRYVRWYNTRTYKIYSAEAAPGERKAFKCQCQGWKARNKKRLQDPSEGAPNCSHCGAVYEFLKRIHMQRRSDSVQAGMLQIFE